MKVRELAEKRLEDIKESAEEVVDSFAEIEKELPTQEETYYSQDRLNVLRPDGEPTPKGELEEFRKNFLEIMPEQGDEGSLKVEVAEWTK